jgi:RNA polymerase sigma-70 factor (ECF subfamily)
MNSAKSFEKRNPSTVPPSYAETNGSHGGDGAGPTPPEDQGALSDQELMGLIVQQKREALELLYDRYAGAVYSLAVHMLRDRGAAEEVAQDAFLNVWRRASSFRPERGKVAAWLFSIAHHRVIDEVRRRRRREQTHVFHDVDLANHPSDDAGDPLAYAILQVRRSILREAMSALRPEQREVVALAYYGGLTHSEIAERLNQPLGTVKTRMRLALKKLREVMAPQSQEWVEHGL